MHVTTASRNLKQECYIQSATTLEPNLQPVSGGKFKLSANIKDEGRADVRARGFWRDGQNAYFDVRVTNPECKSQKDKTVKAILKNHETEKKRQYCDETFKYNFNPTPYKYTNSKEEELN